MSRADHLRALFQPLGWSIEGMRKRNREQVRGSDTGGRSRSQADDCHGGTIAAHDVREGKRLGAPAVNYCQSEPRAALAEQQLRFGYGMRGDRGNPICTQFIGKRPQEPQFLVQYENTGIH